MFVRCWLVRRLIALNARPPSQPEPQPSLPHLTPPSLQSHLVHPMKPNKLVPTLSLASLVLATVQLGSFPTGPSLIRSEGDQLELTNLDNQTDRQ